MGRGQRFGLLAAAVLVAIVAFVALRPGDTDEQADDPATRATGTATAPADTESEPTATARSAPPPPPQEVVLKGGRPEGGITRIVVEKGEVLRLLVSSDRPDEIHLHGYDVTRNARPGKPARFRLRADAEGEFEIESRVAEDAGQEALVARLVVEPS